MYTYLISYDLTLPGQNYGGVIARLKQHGAFSVLRSQWALRTTWTAIQLRDDLKTVADSTDRILIVEVSGQWASYNIMDTDSFKKIAA